MIHIYNLVNSPSSTSATVVNKVIVSKIASALLPSVFFESVRWYWKAAYSLSSSLSRFHLLDEALMDSAMTRAIAPKPGLRPG